MWLRDLRWLFKKTLKTLLMDLWQFLARVPCNPLFRRLRRVRRDVNRELHY